MSLKTLLPHAVSKDAVRRKRAGVRKKYEARAIFRSMSFMMLVVGYFVYATFLTGDDSAAIEQVRMKEAERDPILLLYGVRVAAVLFLGRVRVSHRPLQASNSAPLTPSPLAILPTSPHLPCPALQAQIQRHLTNSTDCDLSVAEPGWTLVLYIGGVLYMFVALAIVCDEFFVPALEVSHVLLPALLPRTPPKQTKQNN